MNNHKQMRILAGHEIAASLLLQALLWRMPTNERRALLREAIDSVNAAASEIGDPKIAQAARKKLGGFMYRPVKGRLPGR